VIKTLQDYDNFVISTGGGMVLREENVKMLKDLGPLVLLWAEPDIVFERVKDETHRPLIEEEEKKKRIEQILGSRKEIYHKAADLKVDTSQHSIEESVKRIINYVQSKTES
jgi:shikimate kinase